MKSEKEKKQMMVIGALVLVIVAVGGFQMVSGGGSEAPVASETSKEKKEKVAQEKLEEEKAAKVIKNPSVAVPLPQRDPFRLAMFAAPEPPPEVKPPAPTPPAESKRSSGAGRVPKLPPLPGNLGGGVAGGEVAPFKVEEPTFGYTLTGVITGNEPAAVFTNAQGGQVLVPAGGSIDGDSKVISVRNGKVRVRFHEKVLDMTIGGKPSGN